jgi:hypothetical protein
MGGIHLSTAAAESNENDRQQDAGTIIVAGIGLAAGEFSNLMDRLEVTGFLANIRKLLAQLHAADRRHFAVFGVRVVCCAGYQGTR